LFGGQAELRGLYAKTSDGGQGFETVQWVVNNASDPAAGRFNTSADANGNWYLTDISYEISLVTPKTFFGMFMTDHGDFAGEVDVLFYNGLTFLRGFCFPTVTALKAAGNNVMWAAYGNGSAPFTKVHVAIRQFDYASRDVIGFDDFIIGDHVACTAVPQPQVFYGINTTAVTAKTVAGPAKTARDAWVATVNNISVCDFEGVLSFVGPLSSVTFSISNTTSGDPVFTGSSPAYTIESSAASDRWNTTSGGTKWLEFNDGIFIPFSTTLTSIGFYLTSLGTHNATIVIHLRQADGSGVCYYIPKAAEMNSPPGLLRFWGVVGEIPFVSMKLTVVHYPNLLDHRWREQHPNASSVPRQYVGVDDLLIGN
jgi:hypothetical protein